MQGNTTAKKSNIIVLMITIKGTTIGKKAMIYKRQRHICSHSNKGTTITKKAMLYIKGIIMVPIVTIKGTTLQKETM